MSFFVLLEHLFIVNLEMEPAKMLGDCQRYYRGTVILGPS